MAASAALVKALDRVRRNAGTAALAALAPIAMAAPAHAIASLPTVSIGSTVTPGAGGVTVFSYTVANNAAFGYLNRIVLPELHAGDFSLASFATSYFGFTASESLLPPIPATFKTAGITPGAYVVIVNTNSSEGITAGNSATFSLSSTTPGTLNATFGLSTVDGSLNPLATFSFDPPVPGTVGATAVPEPASLALLGGAVALGMAGAKRRKA